MRRARWIVVLLWFASRVSVMPKHRKLAAILAAAKRGIHRRHGGAIGQSKRYEPERPVASRL